MHLNNIKFPKIQESYILGVLSFLIIFLLLSSALSYAENHTAKFTLVHKGIIKTFTDQQVVFKDGFIFNKTISYTRHINVGQKYAILKRTGFIYTEYLIFPVPYSGVVFPLMII